LLEIRREIEAGKMNSPSIRNISLINIESILTERLGCGRQKLHTARSRNDHVAVDIRLLPERRIKTILYLLKN